MHQNVLKINIRPSYNSENTVTYDLVIFTEYELNLIKIIDFRMLIIGVVIQTNIR